MGWSVEEGVVGELRGVGASKQVVYWKTMNGIVGGVAGKIWLVRCTHHWVETCDEVGRVKIVVVKL